MFGVIYYLKLPNFHNVLQQILLFYQQKLNRLFEYHKT